MLRVGVSVRKAPKADHERRQPSRPSSLQDRDVWIARFAALLDREPTSGPYPYVKLLFDALPCSRPEMPATVIPAAVEFVRPLQ